VADDLLAGGQADAAARVLLTGVEPGEHAEHAGALVGRDADAVVEHRDHPALALWPGLDAHDRGHVGPSEPQGVGHQVLEQLAQEAPVPGDLTEVVGGHLRAGLLDGAGEIGERGLGHLVEGDRGGRAEARAGRGIGQQVVDERPHPVCAPGGDVDQRQGGVTRLERATEARHRHLDAGERGSQVVGGGMCEALELLVGALELGVAVGELGAGVGEGGGRVGPVEGAEEDLTGDPEQADQVVAEPARLGRDEADEACVVTAQRHGHDQERADALGSQPLACDVCTVALEPIDVHDADHPLLAHDPAPPPQRSLGGGVGVQVPAPGEG
jgi:hypothetical protein